MGKVGQGFFIQINVFFFQNLLVLVGLGPPNPHPHSASAIPIGPWSKNRLQKSVQFFFQKNQNFLKIYVTFFSIPKGRRPCCKTRIGDLLIFWSVASQWHHSERKPGRAERRFILRFMNTSIFLFRIKNRLVIQQKISISKSHTKKLEIWVFSHTLGKRIEFEGFSLLDKKSGNLHVCLHISVVMIIIFRFFRTFWV